MRGNGVRGATFALAAALLAATSGVSISAAQAQQQAAQGQFNFDIPAKPVTLAVNDIGRVSGLSVVFRENRPISATGNPVRGSMTAKQALATLLSGTGLGYSFSNPTTVQVFQMAAESNDSPVSAEGATMLDPITIYGSRSSTTLHDTAASVGIVTAQDIDDSQLRGVRDTFRRLGNVTNGDWTDNGFIIRGVNSEGLVPGGAPLASTYIDGVQQTTFGTRRGARGLWDVEQVELYRGPQSTLSGRAAMAGALYIKTKDPTFDKEAELSGTVGTDGLVGTAFMVNTPVLDDQVAIRIAGAFERSKNDINYPTFADYDRYDEFTHATYYQVRGKVLFQPSEMPETQALLSYSFSHDDPYVRDVGGPALGFNFEDERGDFQDAAYIEYRPTDVHNVGLEITHDLTDALRFTSQSSYSYSDVDRLSANYGTDGDINTYDGYYKNHLASQEFRLNYEGERLSWVAGVYGSYEDEKNRYQRTTGSYTNQKQYKTQKTGNLALFGEATYEFVPTWKFTLGGRLDYTAQDSTEYFQRTRPLGGTTTVLTDFAASFDELNFVPKISLSKDLTENQTVGLSYSQGFRTGGSSYDTVNLETYAYEPEKASTYELFYKGRFLDDRLVLNANVFHTRYEDQQVRVYLVSTDYTTQRIINAGSGAAWGFEIEPTFRITDQLDAFVSLGYTHTEFKEFNSATYGDLAGMPFPEAPEWTIGLGGRYTFLNGFYVGADAKYTSSHLARLGSLPHDYIDPRWVANMQAGYKADRWELNAFAENLLDAKYFVYNDNDIAATLGERRKFGLNLKVKF